MIAAALWGVAFGVLDDHTTHCVLYAPRQEDTDVIDASFAESFPPPLANGARGEASRRPFVGLLFPFLPGRSGAFSLPPCEAEARGEQVPAAKYNPAVTH